MSLTVYDDGIWRYEPAGRDVLGRPVYRAYCLGDFAGYRYRRTRAEAARLRRKYGPAGRPAGISAWADCPEWCVKGL